MDRHERGRVNDFLSANASGLNLLKGNPLIDSAVHEVEDRSDARNLMLSAGNSLMSKERTAQKFVPFKDEEEDADDVYDHYGNRVVQKNDKGSSERQTVGSGNKPTNNNTAEILSQPASGNEHILSFNTITSKQQGNLRGRFNRPIMKSTFLFGQKPQSSLVA
jgi:hypothetical protein